MRFAHFPRISAFSLVPPAFPPVCRLSSLGFHPSSIIHHPFPSHLGPSARQATGKRVTWGALGNPSGILARFTPRTQCRQTGTRAFSRQARFGPQQPAKAGVPPRGDAIAGLSVPYWTHCWSNAPCHRAAGQHALPTAALAQMPVILAGRPHCFETGAGVSTGSRNRSLLPLPAMTEDSGSSTLFAPVDTPALLLDAGALKANIQRMARSSPTGLASFGLTSRATSAPPLPNYRCKQGRWASLARSWAKPKPWPMPASVIS